jgi:nitrite reductase/ring-hydroxylating ferredoxin subunit
VGRTLVERSPASLTPRRVPKVCAWILTSDTLRRMADDGWIAVGALDDLPDGKGQWATAGDATVLLVRSGDRVFALGNRCTHQGAPLDRGRLQLGESIATVTCPAHGSVFDLHDGRVLRGPAAEPEEAFETRVVAGRVEIRSA